MKRLLERAWFPEAPAARPAILRILLGTYCLWYLGKRYQLFLRIARSDPATFKPVGVASGLDEPVPVAVFRRLLIATLLANVAFILGWKHRYSGPLFSGLLLWLFSYRNSWSMIYHSDNILVFHALILGFAPAADTFSLDALSAPSLPSRSSLAGTACDPPAGWQYGWPIRLMNITTVLTYFVSGVAKIAGPMGWGWASGEGLRSQVTVDGLRKELLGSVASPLAYKLHDKMFLFQIGAFGSLVLELAAPLALADRRSARLWAIGALLMHWGILLIMNIKFRYQLSGLVFAPFFDVERLMGWPGSAMEKRCGRSRDE